MSRIRKPKSLAIVPLLLFTLNSLGQLKGDYKRELDSLLISPTSIRAFNGVVLIAEKGKTKYVKTLGCSKFAENLPLKQDDHFLLLSNTKQITAVLLLQAIDKGLVDV